MRHWFLGALMLCLLRVAPVASGESIGGSETDSAGVSWIQNYTVTAVIEHPGAGGTPTGGEVFDSSDYQAMLILPLEGDLAYVIDLGSMAAFSFPREKVAPSADSLRFPQLSTGKKLGPIEVAADASISFSAPGVRVRIEPASSPVGEITLEDLARSHPVYLRRAAAYHPNQGKIQLLRALAEPVEVLAFFGTWCQTCKEFLPQLIKTVQEVSSPNLALRLVALDEDMQDPSGLSVEHGIVATPTFVVLFEGEEIGRMEEAPSGSVEANLVSILRAQGLLGR